ncbi:MAG: DUF6584 family protein [Flavobacterium sp.]
MKTNCKLTFVHLQNKLDIINGEITKGLKLRAADRLTNLLGHYPDEMRIRHMLAELYYESGFLDAAGKYWILTEPTEERIKKCVEIYEKSVNYSGNQILKDLVYRGDKANLPEYAQRKLEALEAHSKSVTGNVPRYTRKHFSHEIKQTAAPQTSTQKIREKMLIGCFALVAIIVLMIFVEGLKSSWHYLFG